MVKKRNRKNVKKRTNIKNMKDKQEPVEEEIDLNIDQVDEQYIGPTSAKPKPEPIYYECDDNYTCFESK